MGDAGANNTRMDDGSCGTRSGRAEIQKGRDGPRAEIIEAFTLGRSVSGERLTRKRTDVGQIREGQPFPISEVLFPKSWILGNGVIAAPKLRRRLPAAKGRAGRAFLAGRKEAAQGFEFGDFGQTRGRIRSSIEIPGRRYRRMADQNQFVLTRRFEHFPSGMLPLRRGTIVLVSRPSRKHSRSMTSIPFQQRLAELRIAIATLSRLPVGIIPPPVPSVSSARWAFPLVGVLVGGLVALSHSGMEALGLPPFVCGFAAIAVGLLVTGAIHEDGLADCADGFWGGTDRERKLEIMRDSRIGAFGTLALIVSFVLRGAAIASLVAPVLPIVCVAVLSRYAMVLGLEFMPRARSDGLGASASDGPSHLLSTSPFALAAVGILVLAFGPAALWAAGAILLAGLIWTGLAIRHIGGQTGDVLGGLQQVSEIAGIVALSALAI